MKAIRGASPLLPLIVAVLALAACQSAPPPSVAPPRAARATPRPPPPGRVEGAWSFSVTGERCTATVTHREATLGITAGPEPQASLSLSAPGRRSPGRARLAFRGEDGSWEAPARGSGRIAQASIALDDAGEERLRTLLGGGTLSLSGAEWPTLGVPDAGVSGRDWYGCVARLARRGATAPPEPDA